MIGLDRAFKPEWVYRILQKAKPGRAYQDVEEAFNSIIEFEGLKSKKNIMTIIRRYYLSLSKKGGVEYFNENYLYDLSLRYSFDSIKPILLFVLICKSDVVQFIQDKINLKYMHNGNVDRAVILQTTKSKYGDRRVVKYAVGYYLTILEHFGLLKKEDKEYVWKNKKMGCTSDILKEIILLYAAITHNREINLMDFVNNVSLTYIDLTNIEDVIREFNSGPWAYQKRLDNSKIIIKEKVKI